jgi:preprotein translocase subunit SecG
MRLFASKPQAAGAGARLIRIVQLLSVFFFTVSLAIAAVNLQNCEE